MKTPKQNLEALKDLNRWMNSRIQSRSLDGKPVAREERQAEALNWAIPELEAVLEARGIIKPRGNSATDDEDPVAPEQPAPARFRRR